MKTISTGRDPGEGTKEWYERMYKDCQIRPEFIGSVKWAANILLKYKSRYQAVEQMTSVKW